VTRILLTGMTGQVGAELAVSLAPLGEVFACDRNTFDLGDPAAIVATVRKLRPDIIVNAAAYTAVDRAEAEPALAMAVNGTAPGVLAEEALRLNAVLVHYSTDYVFDGTKREPYDEDDAPNPLSVYGRTKLAGDRAVQTSGAKHLILRTSWVYGAIGRNFLTTIQRLAAERDELKIVDDQIGAPTWSRDIAIATSAILARSILSDGAQTGADSGTYNLSAQGSTSWHEFAAVILAQTSDVAAKPRAKLIAIPTAEYPSPAARPRNSVLSHDKLQRTFGVEMPHWRESVSECLAEKR
jgi:dTDP-4-dehydrorhamnose reductase